MVIRRQLASEPVNVLCCFGAQQLPPVRAARLPAFVSPDQGVVPKLGHVIEHELPRALLGVLPHLIRSRAAPPPAARIGRPAAPPARRRWRRRSRSQPCRTRRSGSSPSPSPSPSHRAHRLPEAAPPHPTAPASPRPPPAAAAAGATSPRP